MCVWCDRYSEGAERWYFNPANYARRLYKIRREEVEAAGAEANPQRAGGMTAGGRPFQEAKAQGNIATMERIRKEAEERAWATHFGQVVTLEETLQIVDLIYPIGRMTCNCRRSMRGLPDEENFTCIGMGPGMYKWERWPDTYRGGVEFLTTAEAKDLVTRLHHRGYVQCMYTFGTPYLGGICNCDYPDCGGFRTTVDLGIKCVWKGHYVAQVDPKKCNGCGLCVSRCQFKALSFNPSYNIACVDQFQCFGCGQCKIPCKPNAISLLDRKTIPALASVW